MGRMIDADAAIDALCKSECGWNNAECRHKDGTDFYVTCDNVKIIKSLPSVQPERKIGRWIPCSERRPDKGDDYLVTLWDDGRTWVEIALWNETFGGRWQAVLYNDVDYSDISNVIAWMPLPEPYQEGGEADE